MFIRTVPTEIMVEGRSLNAMLTAGASRVPGVLLVHGWDSDQGHYRTRAEEIVALGCVCLTFDMRGHGCNQAQHDTVSREDNLRDVLAAYDLLARQDTVDPKAIALVGTSYGGYLAALACNLRPVRWLALRAPAIYPDAQWDAPKEALDRDAIDRYRQEVRAPDANRALAACAAFRGDALIVRSELDSVIPLPVIESYVEALKPARSLTYRCVAGADHALSSGASQQAYDMVFTSWLTQMLIDWRAA